MIIPSIPKALSSLWRTLVALVKRRPIFAEKIEVDFRRRVCKVCPHYSESLGQCKVCTCFVSAKTLLSTESCPKGFWNKTT
jgi:hypothetical protein